MIKTLRDNVLTPIWSYSKENLTLRRVIYIFCFFMFCVIDQRIKTCSGRDGLLEMFRNLSGVVMGVLIMTFWSKEEFSKYRLASLIWAGLWLAGGIVAFVWGLNNRPFMNEWTVTIVNVGLYGWLLLHLLLSIWNKRQWKNIFVKGKKWNIPLLVLLLMLVLMILSRSTYLWPLGYLAMFGTYYYFSGDKVRRREMIRGMCDGILVAFFAFWAYCLVFRPFDRVRYQGIYHNPNLNALFYLMCLAAILTKWIDAIKKGSVLIYRIFIYVIMGCILSFLFMSIGRIAWFSAFVMVLLAVIILAKRGTGAKPHNNKIPAKIGKAVATRLALVVMTTAIMLPICFTTVRLFPPFFHHPVWFWGEWSEDRVHSWDLWDSDKFIDPGEFTEAAFGRVAKTFGDLLSQSPLSSNNDVTTEQEVTEQGAAEQETTEQGTVEQEVTEQEATEQETAEQEATDQGITEQEATEQEATEQDTKEPVMTDPSTLNNGFLIRGNIYWWYFKHLNMLGHPADLGFQLQVNYWIGHAHNIFLQMGIDFGIPVMLLFAAVMLISLRVCGRKLLRTKGELIEYSMCFFVVIAILIFGMIEYSWKSCSLNMILLFLTWRIILVPERQEREE
jgi:hypothetical protein